MTEWTGDMADVVDICGEDVAQMLVERLPGILLYVPKALRDTGPIAELPLSIAERLVKSFGGDDIYVHKKRISVSERFQIIERLLDQGLTQRDIAMKLGLTEARVWQIRHEHGAPKLIDRVDPRQINLFDD